MKTGHWFIISACLAVSPFAGISQCGNTIRTVSYDSTVTGTGETPINPYTFTFPKFDGSQGTLMAVNISSVVDLIYNYNVENKETNSKLFRLRVTRYDDIVSTSLSGPVSSAITTPMAPSYYDNVLQADDYVTGSGTDYATESKHVLNNSTVINHNVPNVVDYLGAGTVAFDYYTAPGLITVGLSNTQFNSSATDQIKFTITYTYCDNIVLGNTPGRITRSPAQPDISEPGIRVLPNPSRDGNITVELHKNTRSDWQVDMFNAAGQLVLSKQFNNAVIARMNTDYTLSSGVYIVRVINKKTQERFSKRLVVSK